MQEVNAPAVRVVDVRPTARHAGAQVRPDRAQDDDHAPGHVLATVRTDPLDHRLRAAVAHREAHSCPAHEVQAPVRRAIQTGVAGNRLLLRFWQFHLGSDDHGAARKALADVVVGLAVEGYLDSPGQECPEALTGRAAKLEPNGLPRPGDLASFHGSCQTGAEGSVGGRDPQDAFGWALAARQL